jgi:putative ATP-dependent endonuclease of OLD family
MQTSGLTPEDLRKLKRMVMNTRGELLFARAIMLCSGETEEQALPVFSEKYWGRHPHDLGISIIGVGGDGSYLPFLRLAESFTIPWFVYSDGEPDTVRKLEAALGDIGQTTDRSGVIILGGGRNIEQCLTKDETYKNALIDVIVSAREANKRHRTALLREWRTKKNVMTKLYQELSSKKTQYAPLWARAIADLDDVGKRFPCRTQELLGEISTQLGLAQAK